MPKRKYTFATASASATTASATASATAGTTVGTIASTTASNTFRNTFYGVSVTSSSAATGSTAITSTVGSSASAGGLICSDITLNGFAVKGCMPGRSIAFHLDVQCVLINFILYMDYNQIVSF